MARLPDVSNASVKVIDRAPLIDTIESSAYLQMGKARVEIGRKNKKTRAKTHLRLCCGHGEGGEVESQAPVDACAVEVSQGRQLSVGGDGVA